MHWQNVRKLVISVQNGKNQIIFCSFGRLTQFFFYKVENISPTCFYDGSKLRIYDSGIYFMNETLKHIKAAILDKFAAVMCRNDYRQKLVNYKPLISVSCLLSPSKSHMTWWHYRDNVCRWDITFFYFVGHKKIICFGLYHFLFSLSEQLILF